MFTSETQIIVRYAETDQMQVVYHGNYAQYFEVAGRNPSVQLGLTYADMEAVGIMMPIIELHTNSYALLITMNLHTLKVFKGLLPYHRIEFHHDFKRESEIIDLGRVLALFYQCPTKKKQECLLCYKNEQYFRV